MRSLKVYLTLLGVTVVVVVVVVVVVDVFVLVLASVVGVALLIVPDQITFCCGQK